jgi:hypothetical protein
MKYLIHDNGGLPFMVSVENNYVDIFSYTFSYDIPHEQLQEIIDNKSGWNNFVMRINNPLKVFVGIDNQERIDEREDGNTMLIQSSSNKYIYVGPEIFEFTSDEQIQEYYSPIGNNDVPYPYAIVKAESPRNGQSKDTIYLLAEKVAINGNITGFFDKETDPFYPYHLYYASKGMTVNSIGESVLHERF